jgi:bla regulator protein BlaR1
VTHYRLALVLIFAGTAAPALATASGQQADHASYVYFAAASQSSTMSGSTGDWNRAKALRVRREGLLYFRLGNSAYVIRDAATLKRAEAILAPQRALGEQQAELGSRQAALGRQQAALGQQQARLGRQARHEHDGDAVGARQDVLSAQQNVLSMQQDGLSARQDGLSREQERVGGQVDAGLRALFIDAVRSGLAQRVK